MSHKTAPFRTPVLCGNRSSGVQEFKRYPSTVNRVFVSCSVMLKSSLPDMSHKTAPFRTPVLCGNRSSGVQEFKRYPSTVNRVFVSCSGMIESSLLLVCHTERLLQSPCSLWEQELNRYPSTVKSKCFGLSFKAFSNESASWTSKWAHTQAHISVSVCNHYHGYWDWDRFLNPGHGICR